MDLFIHVPTGTLLSSRKSSNLLPEAKVTQKNGFPVNVWFLDDGPDAATPIVVVPIPEPYTRIVISGRPNDDLDNALLLFFLDDFAEEGEGDTIHYTGTLNTNTADIAALFPTQAKTRAPALMDVDLLVTADPQDGRHTIVKQRDIWIYRALWQGTEGVDPDAVPSYPLPAEIERVSRKGVANGYADLDADGKVPATNLPPLTLTMSGVLHNSPVTFTAGNATATLATQAANTVLAGPASGNSTVPTFRAITNSDLPSNISLSGNLTVNGSTTLGDASGDSLAINAGTLTAPNASSVNATNVANVGALDARYASPLSASWISIVNANQISRTYTLGGTATASDMGVSVVSTTTQGNYGIAYAFSYQGATASFTSSNLKEFANKCGFLITGYLACRPVGGLTRFIVGGGLPAADMLAEGTLPSDGIALESRSFTANNPQFRLVVRSGASTVVGNWSQVFPYFGAVADFWVLLNNGSCYFYARQGRTGAWTLFCSVSTAVPFNTSGVSFAFVCSTPDAGAISYGNISVIRMYETFGITP